MSAALSDSGVVDGIAVPDHLAPVRTAEAAVSEPPLWWVLAASGGCGASSLAHWWSPAAVSPGRAWPCGSDVESPYVVIAARETMSSLTAAHDLLRQWVTGRAGEAIVVGLVVTADRPHGSSNALRRFRSTVASLAPNCWWVDYNPHVPELLLPDLPTWAPGDATPARRTPVVEAPPQHVVAAGVDIVDEITELESGTGRPP